MTERPPQDDPEPDETEVTQEDDQEVIILPDDTEAIPFEDRPSDAKGMVLPALAGEAERGRSA